jgi:dTDP-glucose 4,6-dehydratase
MLLAAPGSAETWLVTGGAGFIGRAVLAQLLAGEGARPSRLVVLDAFTEAAHRPALEALAARGRSADLLVVPGDVADPAAVDALFRAQRPSVVLNLAAETHVDRSLRDAAPFVRTNVSGTWVLLQAARAHGVRRFVQVSTDEVYGDRHGRRPARPSDPCEPSNPYAATKACADALVLAAARAHGLDAVITRGCNTYGPGQYPEKLLPLAARLWARGEPMPVYGDGRQRREWIHVDDHAAGIVAAARHAPAPGTAGAPRVLHLGSGRRLENLEVLAAWWDVLGFGEPGSPPPIRFVPDRPGHDRAYALSRISAGNIRRIPLRRGLAATARWQRANPDFWSLRDGGDTALERWIAGHYRP